MELQVLLAQHTCFLTPNPRAFQNTYVSKSAFCLATWFGLLLRRQGEEFHIYRRFRKRIWSLQNVWHAKNKNI